MLKNIKRVLLISMFLIPINTNAIFEQPIDKKYNIFYEKVVLKYKNNTDVLKFLLRIKKAIIKLQDNNNLSYDNSKLIERIDYLNTYKINRLEGINSVENGIINSSNLFLNQLELNGIKYIPVNTNKYEFIENNRIKKIIFKKYNLIDSKNYEYFIKNYNKGIVINGNNNDFYFLKDYSFEEKIEYNSIGDSSIIYAEGFNNPIYIENGSYKKINYNKYYNLNDDKYGFYISDLKNLGSRFVIYNKNNNFSVITDYNIMDIIEEGFLDKIKNKEGLLDLIIDDQKYININDKSLLLFKLRLETKKITDGKTDKEKIKVIYDYILNKLEYYQGDYSSHKEVFSGILSYKNGYSVCDGYVKLFGYMLFFAGIEDFEIKKGYVINSTDFPDIGHAWIEILGKYYDPTFDDPLGINDNKIFNEYKYYDLPYDILYASRFDGFDIPKDYFGKSLNFLIELVNSRYIDLLEKYNNYNLLDYYKVVLKLRLNVNSITINDFLKYNSNYSVSEKTYSYIGDSGELNKITGLNYYTFKTNKELDNLIKQLGFKILDMEIFTWLLNNGDTEYRLGYNIKYK